MDKAYLVPNAVAPAQTILIDPDKCIGCNRCAAACRTQTILPYPEEGKPPVVIYPDECWFCGCCMDACEVGALEMRHLISRRIFFKRKATGEVFRIGGPDSPPQSYFKPPVG